MLSGQAAYFKRMVQEYHHLIDWVGYLTGFIIRLVAIQFARVNIEFVFGISREF